MALGFQMAYAQPVGEPICNNPWGPPWCTDGNRSQVIEAQRRAIKAQEAGRRTMEEALMMRREMEMQWRMHLPTYREFDGRRF